MESVCFSKKIAVTGAAGAGKTTCANRLSQFIRVPVYHMDSIIYKPGWKKNSRVEIKEKLQEIFSCDNWIIDGVSLDVYDQAETIVFLDLPPLVCFSRALKRMFTTRRSELPDGLEEKDAFWLLLKLAFLFPLKTRAKILKYKLDSSRNFIHIRSPRELNSFLFLVEHCELPV